MNCKAYAKQLPQYVQGRLPEKKARCIAEHVSKCYECQKTVEHFTFIWSELGSLPEVRSSSVAPRVLARIEAYESRRSGWLTAWLQPLMPSFAGAAAVVMLLGFLSGGLLSSLYFPGSGQEPAEFEDTAYAELLADAPAESIFDIYLQSAGQNGKENSL